MEKISIVNAKNGEKIYLQNARRTAPLLPEGETLPYKFRDMIVFVVARVTGCRISTAYRVVRCVCIKLRISGR